MRWAVYSLLAAFLPALFIVAVLAGCTPLHCTSTLQRGCDPMPKHDGYQLQFPKQ